MPIPKDLELYKMLRRLMRDPIVILMLGDWRTGKTDTSLLVGYLCKKWRLIDRIGSNIFTWNNPEVDYIDSTGLLKKWLHEDKQKKLFLFDEGLKHLYRRKAMSSLNVDIITEIMPEVSKGHGRMVFISQIEKLDSDAIHPAFCRAVWKKLSKKVMICTSKHYPFRKFTGLPASPIKFDADRLAEFFNKKMSKDIKSDKSALIVQAAHLYSNNVPFQEISKQLDQHPEQVKRLIRRGLKWFVENYEESNGSLGKKKVNPAEMASLVEKPLK